MASFAGLNAQVLGISVDHIPCLQAWAESLGGINFPLLSDFWPHGATAESYGVFRGSEGKTERAIFILDEYGMIQYIDIHDIDDRPENEEIRKALRMMEGNKVHETAPGLSIAASGTPGEGGIPLSASSPESSRAGEVILYCARWCKDCKKARNWLAERGLEYQELDIDYDQDARDRVRQWGEGRLITPVIDFAGEIILDFDEQKLEEAWRRHLNRLGGF